MKKYFSTDFSGDESWSLITPCLILFIVVNFGPIFAFESITNNWNVSIQSFGSYEAIVLFWLLRNSVNCSIALVFLSLLIPRLIISKRHFTFNGNVGEYLRISTKGFILSIITMNLYLPWFLYNQLIYLASRSQYNGNTISFIGKPKKLLAALLGFILIGTILNAYFVIEAISRQLIGNGNYPQANTIQPYNFFDTFSFNSYSLIAFLFIFAVALVVVAALISLIAAILMRWCVQFGVGKSKLNWKGRLPRAMMFFASQLLLLLITLGIAWPIVLVKCWNYIFSRLEINREGAVVKRFGFVKDFHYFKMFWTQAILCIVTVGIYLPWAFAKIAGRMVELTYIEDVAAELPEKQSPIEYQI